MSLDPKLWQDRPVLVTGATGLLGACLTHELVRRQADVVCIVRDSIPQSELWRGASKDRVMVVRGDIRNQRLVERVLGEYEIQSVFHLAAQTQAPVANRNP